MKNVFALLAAIAVIASAQASYASATCQARSAVPRDGFIEPTTKVTVKSTVRSVKTRR